MESKKKVHLAPPPEDNNVLNPSKTPKSKTASNPDTLDFPIVGIGASAGGLEALEQFFSNMPKDNGMAFVVIQLLYYNG